MEFVISFFYDNRKYRKAHSISLRDERSFLSLARSLKKNLSSDDYDCISYAVYTDCYYQKLCSYAFERDLKAFKIYLNEVFKNEL